MAPTILGLGGSVRPGSATTLALHVALAAAGAAGAHTQLIDLADLRLPMFDGTYALDGYSAAEQATIGTLLAAADAADGIILASPTYHNTLSGALKNALEILEIGRESTPSRFVGKVVGLVAVQGGTSGTSVNTLTTMLLATRAMGAWVAPTMVGVLGSRAAFDAAGAPMNPAIQARLAALGAEVTRGAAMFAEHWSQS